MLSHLKYQIILLTVILALVSRCITALPVPDAGDPNKIIIPAMARKAGGRLRPELSGGNGPDTTKEEKISGDAKDTEEVYDYSVWPSSSEEEECPDNMYYHIRGKQCVPMRCRGGNKQRNQMTGECMDDYAGFSGSTGGTYGYGQGYSRSYSSGSGSKISYPRIGGFRMRG